MFEEVAARYDGPLIERAVLEFWKREKVFARTLARGRGRPPFVFYEGPPTANGRPGIHHVLARTFKDLYPRYKTMRGYHCERRAGWDTHGLPVEHEVEKALGIYDKRRIEREVGIAQFVELCRASVMRYVADWEAMTERMGFWVDVKHAYYTLHNEYIESVWSLVKRLWDQGLLYRGYKVVPYDPRIGATLSSHEVAQGYREVEDPSVYVRFPVAGETSTFFLVWTTTPWTLPANLLLAVHPEVEYVWVRLATETLILARARLGALGDTPFLILRSALGAELDGARYERLFEDLPVAGEICRVRTAEFVTTSDGTGIVHVAPAYGEDDLALGQRCGLPVVHAVGEDGRFLPEIKAVAGKFFKDADPIITTELRSRGLIFREERVLHSYPFGWRTGDPLIYYAKNAWYVRTTARRERLVELNRTIRWVPQSIRDGRFGDWLAHNVDWALSRERFWGTPLPLWSDGTGEYVCVGSLRELESLVGRDLGELDLHRPAIDAVTFVRDGRTYRRVTEVMDCWFDSGAMPYAQWHFPFEHAADFDASFPADFICEAIDQTRGWFYTLHAIATMVSDSIAYRNVVCLSHIVDDEGRKMSKSLGNILDPYAVFDSVGADALRWHFAARVAPDMQKRVSVAIVADVAKGFLNTFWNVYAFFVLYARLDGIEAGGAAGAAARTQADRWILALLEQTVATASAALERFDALSAGEAIEKFIDQLSNWYVRGNRRRFWKAASGEDKQAAYATLYECLEVVNRLMAPFMPFLSEAVYQNLARTRSADAPLSVHMASWPEPRPERLDRALLDEMDVVQRIVTLGRAARNDARLKVRQPLARLLVRVPEEAAARAVARHGAWILDELNVKRLELIPPDARLVRYEIKPNLPILGKRFGKRLAAVRVALSHLDAAAVAARAARGESIELTLAGEPIELTPETLLIETRAAEGLACAEEGGYLVGLDTTLTDELVREGLAREIVRSVQEARKQAGLNVADRIALEIRGDEAVTAALDAHRDYVAAETLVTQWAHPQVLATEAPVRHEMAGAWWEIRLRRERTPD
ncbi:MAG TPA: isoleucine--tRNA ligase [Steroidobacteraceae bacterium]|nr:isoleucine--tRNA ligase [Steroidobacteraceae bacterium]